MAKFIEVTQNITSTRGGQVSSSKHIVNVEQIVSVEEKSGKSEIFLTNGKSVTASIGFADLKRQLG